MNEETEISTDKQKSMVPYEASFSKGLEKLTDQILVFLLLYMILLIGLDLFAKGIVEKYRPLLYIIPIGGVISYAWRQKKNAVKNKNDIRQGTKIDVKETYGRVLGKQGDLSEGYVDIQAGQVGKDAEIIGESSYFDDNRANNSTDVKFLIDIFEQLNSSDKLEIINNATTKLGSYAQGQENSDS